MLEQLRRDVTMLMRGLAGRTPPPLVKRMERRAVAGRGVAVRMVVVETVARETADAVSLTLRDPSGAELAFTPGQFFTIEATIDGERVRRAYSASGDARDRSRATITVKRVAGGRMSTFLCERAAAGMTLGVLGPSGDFALPAATAPRHVLAIAAAAASRRSWRSPARRSPPNRRRR